MKFFSCIIFLFLSSSLISFAQTEIHIDSGNIEGENATEIIDPIEIPASFPGGQDSLIAYLETNNQWRVGQETIKGKVFVGFVIEKDGSITNIEIVKGLRKDCDAEAIRLIKNMPRWKSGEFRGKPLRTKYVLPITFNGLTD